MLSRLSEPQVRTLGFVFGPLVVVASILLAYAVGSYGLAIVVAIVTVAVIALLSHALTPPWFGKYRAQVYSLGVLSTATIAVLAPDTLWIPIIESVFRALDLPTPTLPDFGSRVIVLAILSCAVVALNFIWSRQQITPPSDVAPSDASSHFSNSGYAELRDEFCNYMVRQLDLYDRDVHWSDSDYRPLEAEVEIDRQGALRPHIARDLIKAIRSDRSSRAFLLLGDPGSGKSVSLRRLCRELYSQVQSTGIVPVYINLREWDGPVEPSDKDITVFLLRHLRLQSGRSGLQFLNTWFESMLDRGLFFFILDSFDEMPAVLDCDDAGNRLHLISSGFNRFFNDLHRCRGILSSRFFRQPRGFRSRRMVIRPFSEAQLRGAMKRWLLGQPISADRVLLQLFRERPEFSSIVRNPFSADLIAQYLIHNPGQLPKSYFSVFEDYVTRRLREDSDSLKDLQLDPLQVLEGATRIAWEMYSVEDVGLDVEVGRLRQLIDDPELDRHLTALRISRLARLGGLRTQRFSFAHRRFAEFFVVRNLMEKGAAIPLDTIPSDSRWRDCLVVYCGIAPGEDARRVAQFCWTTFKEATPAILSGDLLLGRPGIHCLRFLIDGFRGRLECIETFRDELSELLLRLLSNRDLLVAKIAAEGLCLVNDAARNDGLALAVEREVGWVAETAIRSCRHFGKVGQRSRNAIRAHISALPTDELFKRYADLSFSFSLSEGLKGIRRILVFEMMSIVLVWLLWAVFFLEATHGVYFHKLDAARSGSALRCSLLLMSPVLCELFLLIFFSLSNRRGIATRKLRSTGVVRLSLDTSVRLSLIYVLPFGFATSTRLSTMYLQPEFFSGHGPKMVYLLMVAVVPVAFWLGIGTVIRSPRRVFVRLYKALASNWKIVGVMLVALATFGGVIIGLGWFLHKLFGEAFVIFLGAVLAIVTIIAIIWPSVLLCAAIVHDLRFLRSVVIPQVVTRTWVYQMCEKLKSGFGRERFLDALIAKGVQVEGATISFPSGSWTSLAVRERFARLEEKWMGLEL